MSALIWLASYPKSGNTWLRILLTFYFLRSDETFDINRLAIPNAADLAAFQRVGGVDPSELTARELADLRPSLYRLMAAERSTLPILKVHDAFGVTPSGQPLIPADASRAVIYMVRHPCDVAVSLAAHFGTPLEEAVSLMLRPGATIGQDSRLQVAQTIDSWSRHVEGWTRQKDIETAVIRYEDLHDDIRSSFARVLGAVGVAVDSTRAEEAVAAAQFELLRAREVTAGFVERPQFSSTPFFRSGRVGAWRETMPSELVRRIVDAHGPTMRRFGYDVAGNQA